MQARGGVRGGRHPRGAGCLSQWLSGAALEGGDSARGGRGGGWDRPLEPRELEHVGERPSVVGSPGAPRGRSRRRWRLRPSSEHTEPVMRPW